MNHVLISSLEHIAVAKIATTLWNQMEIRNLMEDFLSSMKNSENYIVFLNSESKEEWIKVEDNVRKKVHQLPLAELLKEKVLNSIKPIGSLILEWMTYYVTTFTDIDLPKEFRWTSRGMLDETETAKLLIKDKNINITRRYKISCIYCLEDNIKELWNKLPEDSKKSIYSERYQNQLISFWTNYINQNKLVRFFINFINGCDYIFLSCCWSLCLHACRGHNRAAAEYFFKKSGPSSRYNVLYLQANEILYLSSYSEVSRITPRYDIIFNLLIHASKEQQIEFFQMCPFAVLFALDWPWQSFFTEIVNCLRICLPEDCFDHTFYGCLLKKIISKIIYGYKDFRYQDLLKEYWQQSSDPCKKYFCYSNSISRLLSNLFAMKDIDNIKMILHDPAISVHLDVVKRNVCKDTIKNEEWDLLKFFIQECVLSKIEMLKFKADMEKCMSELSTKKWNIFISLLEEIN